MWWWHKFLDSCISFSLQNTHACSHPKRLKHLCLFLPVCVELICVVEEVEFGDVTGRGRLNGFLLDTQQMFGVGSLVRAFSIHNIKYFIHLWLGKKCDLRRSSTQIQDAHCLPRVGVQVPYEKINTSCWAKETLNPSSVQQTEHTV